MYKVYRVAACKMSVVATIEGVSSNEPLVIGLVMSDQNLTSTTWGDWALYGASNKNATSFTLGLFETKRGKLYRRMSTVVGNPRNYWGNDAYAALVTTNPASLIYGYVSAITVGGGVATQDVVLKTTITYYIKFSNVDIEVN